MTQINKKWHRGTSVVPVKSRVRKLIKDVRGGGSLPQQIWMMWK